MFFCVLISCSQQEQHYLKHLASLHLMTEYKSYSTISIQLSSELVD